MNTEKPEKPVYNSLLTRQLRKNLPEGVPDSVLPLLKSVSGAYDTYERDREMIERAMNLSSDELMGANEDLKKANQELDRFVYSVSHDLRAPIASVLGLLNLIKTEDKPETQAYYHRLMTDSLHRLDSFIHDIIDYSRNNRLENQPEQIDFKGIIEEVAAGLRYMPNASKVTLDIALDNSHTFYSDKRRLIMILSNLIGNAVRYRNPQSANSYVRVTTEIAKNTGVIKIEDNGLGIEGEYLPRIFEMFFRAHERSEGSGLGLYIVNEAVKKLEGSIKVKSAVSVGTTFTLTLPNLEGHAKHLTEANQETQP